MAGTPEMQEQFPAGASMASVLKNEALFDHDGCRKCRSNFRRVPSI